MSVKLAILTLNLFLLRLICTGQAKTQGVWNKNLICATHFEVSVGYVCPGRSALRVQSTFQPECCFFHILPVFRLFQNFIKFGRTTNVLHSRRFGIQLPFP